MPQKDATAPATKADLMQLHRDLLDRFETIDQRFAAMEKRIADEAKDTRLHFDVSLENFRDEITGAFSDRTAQFEQKLYKLTYRIRAIERKLELAS